MTIDCHSALDLLGQKYISAIFCYDAYVFPHTLNFSITCSQTKVLFISQHYKPFVWIFMLTFTYINQTLLKTLFSSCKGTVGMTVIPALPSKSAILWLGFSRKGRRTYIFQQFQNLHLLYFDEDKKTTLLSDLLNKRAVAVIYSVVEFDEERIIFSHQTFKFYTLSSNVLF